MQTGLNGRHMPIALHEEQLANIERVAQLTKQNVPVERELGLRVQALDDCRRDSCTTARAHTRI